jgi:hypothetical protein
MVLWDEPNVELKAKVYKVLTASISKEVKNNHAHVTTQRILNKLMEVNFSEGYMVLAVTTSKTINIDKCLGG